MPQREGQKKPSASGFKVFFCVYVCLFRRLLSGQVLLGLPQQLQMPCNEPCIARATRQVQGGGEELTNHTQYFVSCQSVTAASAAKAF